MYLLMKLHLYIIVLRLEMPTCHQAAESFVHSAHEALLWA